MKIIRLIGIITSFLMLVFFIYVFYDIYYLRYSSVKPKFNEGLMGIGLITVSLFQLLFLVFTIKFADKNNLSKLDHPKILDASMFNERKKLYPRSFRRLNVLAFLSAAAYLIFLMISLKSNFKKFTKLFSSFDLVSFQILIFNILMLITSLSVLYILFYSKDEK